MPRHKPTTADVVTYEDAVVTVRAIDISTLIPDSSAAP
jgi:hypothetical protein